MPKHDNSYKLLFSHREMIIDLLTGFVQESWIQQLDFSTLENYKTDFISEKLDSRHDDIIWRVKHGHEWLYIYLLLEFQSSVDPFMAVRLWVYIGLLYQHLIKTEKLTIKDKLPPILPIVLYNGNPRWHAALSLEELIHPAPAELNHYRPQLHYLLIDEMRYQDIELSPLKNLVAALFRMENSRKSEQGKAIILEVIEALINWLEAPEQGSLRRAFATWLKQVYLPKHLPNTPLPTIEGLQDMRNMLEEHIEEWYRSGIEKGILQGILQGKEEGIQQGMQEGSQKKAQQAVIEVLKTRFGKLPLTLTKQIKEIKDEKVLSRCHKQAILTQSLAEFEQFLLNLKNLKTMKKVKKS